MTGAISRRVHRLADSLGELKVRVRAALATELAGAVGTAVRDVLVVALVDRMIAAPTRSPHSSPRTGAWRDEEYDRDQDRWGEPRDPWTDEYDPRERVPSRDAHHDREEAEPPSVVPAAAAVVVGANVGRWWLSRHGSVVAAVGLGVLATGLGLAGGPVARAALAVLAAATDLLSAESALARLDQS